jgi:hypothetical protein
MTLGGASLKVVLPKNTAVNEMTFAMLLKIGGVSDTKLCPHCDGLQHRTLL